MDELKDLEVNKLYVIQEGGKILKAEEVAARRESGRCDRDGYNPGDRALPARAGGG